MLILFFKAARAGESHQEPLQDKMRRILESHVEEAKTDEDRTRAQTEFDKWEKHTAAGETQLECR